MAPASLGVPGGRQVYRSRAVFVAGAIDGAIGLAVVIAGVYLAASRNVHNGLPLGLTVMVLGFIILSTSLGRMLSRLEVGRSSITWVWSFGRHELAIGDLVEAALIEKGSPSSGAWWGGFLGGGFAGVFLWWLLEALSAFVNSEPTLGPRQLMVCTRMGERINVRPITAWSTRPSHSEADEALRAVQAAITSATRPVTPGLSILRTDAWDLPAEG